MKALRLYDRMGLLRPADVDPANGYRRYRETQLFTARLIVALRRLDMPLTEVAQIVAAPGTVGAERLEAYWDEVERRTALQRTMAAHLRTSLLGGDARFGEFEIRERDVPAQLVLTEQRHVGVVELDRWIGPAMSRLMSAAQAYGGPAGDQFVIFHCEVNEESDGPVEVCVPVSPPRGVPTDTDTAMRREPAHREAYVRVTKAQFEPPQILSAYDAVERWIGAKGLTAAGAPREVYFTAFDSFAEVLAAAPTDDVCDVAFPIC